MLSCKEGYEGVVMLRKTLLVIVLIFVLVSILQSPGPSADYVRQGLGLVTLAVQRIFEFFGGVLQG